MYYVKYELGERFFDKDIEFVVIDEIRITITKKMVDVIYIIKGKEFKQCDIDKLIEKEEWELIVC